MILASSRMPGGRCVAGKEWINGKAGPWVRPVSKHHSRGVSERDRQYENGGEPQVLDIAAIPLLDRYPVREETPNDHQTENWRISSGYYWQKVGRLPRSSLARLQDGREQLWVNGYSSFYGCYDKTPIEHTRADAGMGALESSLRLVFVNRLRLVVGLEGAAFGNTQRGVRGWFTHAGAQYGLKVTDPEIEKAFLSKPDGAYNLGRCYLTISLGRELNGACYKLIAAVIGDQSTA